VDIFWAKTTEFWAALLALFFGLILFLVRKQLKRLFGFDKDDS
jgi:Na+-driven multidrug efflux pump